MYISTPVGLTLKVSSFVRAGPWQLVSKAGARSVSNTGRKEKHCEVYYSCSYCWYSIMVFSSEMATCNPGAAAFWISRAQRGETSWWLFSFEAVSGSPKKRLLLPTPAATASPTGSKRPPGKVSPPGPPQRRPHSGRRLPLHPGTRLRGPQPLLADDCRTGHAWTDGSFRRARRYTSRQSGREDRLVEVHLPGTPQASDLREVSGSQG
jgi:hypothetical protein